MKSLDLARVQEYVNENIVDFHRRKVKSLEELRLEKTANQESYLFKAKNITTAGELIAGLLEAFLPRRKKNCLAIFLRV